MTVRSFVGVTDGDWARHLAGAGADEVNFWLPSGRNFQALSIGEPFFFKTHYPDNRVVGGGFYSGFARLTIREAWDFYREANGASSRHEMLARIAKYRRKAIRPGEDPQIGCVFLRDVSFFAGADSPGPPPDFARNIVSGKTYDTTDPSYASYFEQLFAQMLGQTVELDEVETWHRPGAKYGDPRLAPQRLGQRAFQGVVLDAYRYRCAITGDRIRPVLQAAHIRPLPHGGEHRLDNGLLLRSDLHTLFDRGYVGVDARYRLQVSPRLREEFENGEELYDRARSREPIAVPRRRPDRPNQEFLQWHLDEVFLAS